MEIPADHILSKMISWKELKEFLDHNGEHESFSDDEIIYGLELTKAMTGAQLASLMNVQDQFCVRCGDCCRDAKQLDVLIEELVNIAKYLKVPFTRMRKKYPFADSGDSEVFYLKAGPCPFLKGKNECTIYPVRPKVCRAHPLGKTLTQASTGENAPVLIPPCAATKTLLMNAVQAQIIIKRVLAKYGSEGEKQLQEMYDKMMEKGEKQLIAEAFQKVFKGK